MNELTIYELILRKAQEAPNSIAILSVEREPLTYRGLLEQVEYLVCGLREIIGSKEGPIAVVVPNGAEMAVSFLAVSCAATCAPLNPAYREREFEFYLSDLKASA